MPPTKKVEGKRAEIAVRAHLKCFRESNCQLAREYGVSEYAVRDIIKEYKDKMDEATAAAIMYYRDHPRPVQPAASNQTAAQQLQSDCSCWQRLHTTLQAAVTRHIPPPLARCPLLPGRCRQRCRGAWIPRYYITTFNFSRWLLISCSHGSVHRTH